MNIRFHGAARTVTGSAHLLEIHGRHVLLDCGLYQGKRDLARQFNATLPPALRRLDAVILSHGHLDHCGRLPVLSAGGYRGPIHCTPATAEVATVVMLDSAEIQEEDAAYLNRRSRRPGEPQVTPLYTVADARQARRQFRTTPLARRVELFPADTGEARSIGFTLFEAGHILGSAYVVVDWVEQGRPRHLLFTADIGRYNTPIIPDPAPPQVRVDVLITESTYGGRSHQVMQNVEPELLRILGQTIQTRSRLLIPSFAVGRTQTMMWYIEKFVAEGKIPPIRTYIDSPMGVELTRIYTDCRDGYDEQTRDLVLQKDVFGLRNVVLASSGEQSRAINADPGPCVIIASSPSCEFGRILHHLKKSIERPADHVLFVGWTPPGTLGRRLQDGQKRVRIYDNFYDVACQVTTLPGMSGHGDAEEMLRFARPAVGPQTRCYVVHGEAEQSEAFAARLVRELGVHSALVPAPETSVIEDAAPSASNRPPAEGQ